MQGWSIDLTILSSGESEFCSSIVVPTRLAASLEGFLADTSAQYRRRPLTAVMPQYDYERQKMSINVTVAVPIEDFVTIRSADVPQCNTEVLRALITAIQQAPYDVVKREPPLKKDSNSEVSKKVSFDQSCSSTSSTSTSSSRTTVPASRLRSVASTTALSTGGNGILLSVQDQSAKKTYRLEATTTFGGLKKAYARWNDLPLTSFGLYYRDRELRDDETPEQVCRNLMLKAKAFADVS